MGSNDPETGDSVLSDDELVVKAKNATNGRKFTALYEEGWSLRSVRRYYDTRQRAELALVVQLTWWSRHDREQTVRLFTDSALGRDEAVDHPKYVLQLFETATSLLEADCYDPDYAESRTDPSRGVA